MERCVIDNPTGYRFMDISIMPQVITLAAHPECYCRTLTLTETRMQGFAFQLKLSCAGRISFHSIFDCKEEEKTVRC